MDMKSPLSNCSVMQVDKQLLQYLTVFIFQYSHLLCNFSFRNFKLRKEKTTNCWTDRVLCGGNRSKYDDKKKKWLCINSSQLMIIFIRAGWSKVWAPARPTNRHHQNGEYYHHHTKAVYLNQKNAEILFSSGWIHRFHDPYLLLFSD